MPEQTQTQQEPETGYAAESQTCPGCGMTSDEWRGNNGQGYDYQGQTYCCQGCAEGAGCTCR